MATIADQFYYLDGYIKETFDVELDKGTDYIPMLFGVEKSDRSIENYLGLNAVDNMVKWNGSVAYDTVSQGYRVQVPYEKFSRGLNLEKELFLAKNYKDVKDKVNDLALASYRSMQMSAGNVFDNAFSYDAENLITADGKALCASDHPKASDNAETIDNAGTLALTPKNVDTVMNEMIDWEDSKGNPINVMPDCLIVGTKQLRNAKKVVGSEKEPFDANNGINVYSDGSLKVLYNPFIRENVWFLADSRKMHNMMKWINFFYNKPFLDNDSDFDTEIIKYKVVGYWNKVAKDYRFIYGNQVS